METHNTTMQRTGIQRKGYLFSIDAVVSLVLFIIMFVFIISLWNLYSIRLNENVAAEELQLAAFQITDILTKSGGVPNNWEKNPANASLIGLRRSPGSLDNKKVTAFLSLDYNDTKKKFNIERFEYEFAILDRKGKVLDTAGIAPSNTTAQSISITNFMVLDYEPRQIAFTLWRK